jgi:hypothetical protein
MRGQSEFSQGKCQRHGTLLLCSADIM